MLFWIYRCCNLFSMKPLIHGKYKEMDSMKEPNLAFFVPYVYQLDVGGGGGGVDLCFLFLYRKLSIFPL
jgi:hypothetical protein